LYLKGKTTEYQAKLLRNGFQKEQWERRVVAFRNDGYTEKEGEKSWHWQQSISKKNERS